MASAVRHRLRSEASSEQLAAALGGNTPHRVRLSLPHPAYFLRLDDVASGRTLAAAYSTATRILLSDGEQQVYSIAEIPNSEARFSLLSESISFEYGLLLDHLLADMATLISSSGTQSAPKNAELRLLRLPALQIVAAWLHWAGNTPVDWLLPTGPIPPYLTAQRLYDGSSFLALLRQPAQRELAASDKY